MQFSRKRLVRVQHAVAQCHHAITSSGELCVVRHQYAGKSVGLVQSLNQRENGLGGAGIEIAGRLVRK